MLPIIRKRLYWPEYTNNLFTHDFFPVYGSNGNCTKAPAVNIAEDEEMFRIDLAAPGLEKKDLHLNLKDDLLTISTEKEENSDESNERFMRKEFHYHSFSRSFSLPETVDREKIKAFHKNGILTVHIPKKEENKTTLSREIKIA